MLFGLCRRREERGAAVRRARRCGSLDREGVWTRAATRTRVPLGAAGPATAYSYTGRAERQSTLYKCCLLGRCPYEYDRVNI